ncbi:MAG: Smr/MutS family protein [Candidatus Pacebacteria bacterium]|nr:Smr/MutS family protein [Candidatus Paceibacterota bacterium]
MNGLLDLHGCSVEEAGNILNEILDEKASSHIRIIVGKGIHSSNGPVLRDFVKNFLIKNNIKFSQSKIQDGGEGALEVFIK